MTTKTTKLTEVDALRAAAKDAEKAGDHAHAKALRQAARFEERQSRERKYGCGNVVVFMD